MSRRQRIARWIFLHQSHIWLVYASFAMLVAAFGVVVEDDWRWQLANLVMVGVWAVVIFREACRIRGVRP